MAEIKLTPSQQAVVDNRGGALLVSAAAGSGKTKVLVDRLLGYLCNENDPCNLDDFLVITYTKAAAAELRVKIAQALTERLAQTPENRHLQRQMNRIYTAEICTVHAFCGNLLRTYAHTLDIPADFRVAEETESRMVQERVLENLLEQGYAEENEDFLAMVEAFGYGRDDRRLPEAIKMAHGQMRCRADMNAWLEMMLQALDMRRYQDAAQTPWGSYLLTRFREFLNQQKEKLEKALDEMIYYPRIQKGLEKCFRENVRQLEQLLQCETWDELVANRVTSFGRVGAIREPEDELIKTRLSKIRSVCWQELKKWQELFFAPSEAILQDLAQMTPGAQALLRFAKTFDAAYSAEKKRRKLMDFSDLEHWAIRLLTDPYTHKPTRAAREVAKRYREIMVDEYQDSNEVQDTIFEAISQEGKNRFMVGDVKQSIYGFRLADPALFLRKYLEYPMYEKAAPEEPRKILLADNFRSRQEILAACNDVFRLVMRPTVGGMAYTDAEALRPGRVFPEIREPLVELHCLTNSQAAQEKTAQEAEYVAARIRKMLDEKTQVTANDGLRPVEPGDIVILMRSLSATAGEYLDALGRHGVPAVCDRGGSLLDTSEVQILVAILQIIDNPHQDIPLLTALASPVFGFTPEQLAAPRTENRSLDFYDLICDRVEFAPAMEKIQALREDARWMNLHELVESVFHRTNMLAVFASMPDGVRRERNLMAFRSFTVSFEATGSKALAQLLWYLEQLQAGSGQLPAPKSAAENAVTIMTVHSSKGLEFPVVFLCDLSRKFNMQDMQDAILVDNNLAVGCNRVDHERYVRYPTLAKKAIIHKKTMEAVSEELRVLYVAMTRAKDRLVMTYYSRYLLSELKTINSMLTWPLSDDLCAGARSPGKWILMAALCRTEAGELFAQAGYNEVSRVWDTAWDIHFCDLAEVTQDTVASEQLQQRQRTDAQPESIALLKFRYPWQKISDIPGKLTATQLKGRVQDQEIAEGAPETPVASAYRFRRPVFLTRAMTAAEKGTATHLFMQFADYSLCHCMEGVQAELNRLEAELFLTTEQAQAVQIAWILRFFQSELGRWLVAQKLNREFKFSVLLDAAEYGLDAPGEQVMLQGVVDCFVAEKDGLTILDFKTDRKPMPSRYRPQMEAYANALSKIYQLPVKQKVLYYFATGEAIEL